MPWDLLILPVLLTSCLLLAVHRSGAARISVLAARLGAVPWGWYLLGYPVTVCRIRWTWRKLSNNAGLSVVKRPRYAVVGDQAMRGMALRPIPARLGSVLPTRTGLTARVHLHAGQTPDAFVEAAEALAHAWRVHAARVLSPRRGHLLITATARDPLAGGVLGGVPGSARLLAADVGRIEDGGPWTLDFRRVPHQLITGATQSGKSNLTACLVRELAPQPVALVGIDCKGGMELSLFEPRLSKLVASRTEAVSVLTALVTEAERRMKICRAAGVRSIWELPEDQRPVPVIVLIDEIAELYLSDGSRNGKQEVADCATSLLRLGQLGAALGVHLVVAGQRFGSELGSRVTALRAQLGGRICHRVNDEETAEMTLGDLAPDAVTVAQSITEDEQGIAVTTHGGLWVRARSTLTSTTEARETAARYADMTPVLPGLEHQDGKESGDL